MPSCCTCCPSREGPGGCRPSQPHVAGESCDGAGLCHRARIHLQQGAHARTPARHHRAHARGCQVGPGTVACELPGSRPGGRTAARVHVCWTCAACQRSGRLAATAAVDSGLMRGNVWMQALQLPARTAWFSRRGSFLPRCALQDTPRQTQACMTCVGLDVGRAR